VSFEAIQVVLPVFVLLETVELQSETKGFDPFDEEAENTNFFLSGCKMGDVKLWNLRGDCLRTYASSLPRSDDTAISSVKPRSMFIVSHQDGSTRLWEAWSGVCLSRYSGHSQAVTCVCSMQDGRMFVSGSKDTTLKLWDTSAALDSYCTFNDKSEDSVYREAGRRAQFTFDQSVIEVLICARTFVCPSQPSEILCVSCIEKSSAFVAGSADGLIRLWAVDSGLCLRTLQGHWGPVTAIEVVDRVTILSGSTDTHVKVWDAVSGICLRTYSDHSDYVTSLSVADDDHTFLATSADLTVKIWVITSVPNYAPGVWCLFA
jgi:WD40 repeat protein